MVGQQPLEVAERRAVLVRERERAALVDQRERALALDGQLLLEDPRQPALRVDVAALDRGRRPRHRSVALRVGSSPPSVMVSPSWSTVHLMKNDVAMIVTNVMTTALTVVRFHFTWCEPTGPWPGRAA